MNERKQELDVIRVIACFMVVVIHVAGYGMEIKNPMTLDWMTRNLVVCAVRCAVPVFFMLSGILFMEKEMPLKVLYKKYIARLVVAWSVWSALYAMIDVVAYMKNNSFSLEYFMTRLMEGHYHLWFLPALLTVYIFLPVIQSLVKNCSSSCMKYLGAILLIGVIGRETLTPFLGGAMWESIWNNLQIPSFSCGMIYFVVGYYIYDNRKCISEKVCLLTYVICVGVMAGINAVCSYVWREHATPTNNYLNVCVLITSVAFFGLLLHCIQRKHIQEKAADIFKNISNYTFGIYLIHTLFIEQVYRRIGLIQENFPVVISIVLFTLLTFILSFISVWCIRKIPVIGKWIT